MKLFGTVIVILVGIFLVACCCLVIALGGVYVALTQVATVFPTIAVYPPNGLPQATPTPFAITRQSPDILSTSTLDLLEQSSIPENDPAELACRFEQICNVPAALPPPTVPLKVGAQASFWVNNEDTHAYFQVDATLRDITPHVYFWVENGVYYNSQALHALVNTFENKIYPTDRAFFGSEWTPGVDGDPHIYILYAGGLGVDVAGYYFSPDEYNPLIQKYSNAHEIFYINSSESLSADYTYGSLAHEFQHMIQWYQDRNEGAFLNEGFSELATFLNGYDTGGFDWLYMMNPDINLTDWLESAGANSAHYGANFLFVTYFLDRFGEQVTRELVHDQHNGLESLDAVLAQNDIKDGSTGLPVDADDFFLDWTITNYIQDVTVADGRYAYHNYPDAPEAYDTEGFISCPLVPITRTVNQYGVDYLRISCAGDYTLHFEGSTSTRLLPVDPLSGSYAFWSNQGDLSDMTLTHQFDFSGVSAPISLTYWTWYDIEADYDYLYLEASTDGDTWQILTTRSCTTSNPNGSSYGCGYTGSSDGWLEETIDLSYFAGQQVSLRFEYLTDPEVTGEGLLLDDLSIPAIGYATDFEADQGGWQPQGFIRIRNLLPQTFRLALITHTSSGTYVQEVATSADQVADIALQIDKSDTQDVVLVVTATTRFTRQLASYQLDIH